MMYAESGLDVRFDLKSIGEATANMTSGEAFAEYLEALGFAFDEAANMDW